MEPDFDTMRHAMVASQLRTAAVDDARVVAAMAMVPRERFLPATLRHQAYRDTGTAIAGGRGLNVPIATGRLLTAARIVPSDRVLLIGAATGYAAAVLSELAGAVVAVESDPDLLAIARQALADRSNVTLVEGPLTDGAPDEEPFDVLVVDGAVAALPEALMDQLRPGARIATGVVDRGVTRLAHGVRSAGGVGLQAFADIDCMVLPGFAPEPAFSF